MEILVPIIIALITSVLGPVLLEWTKRKLAAKPTDPLVNAIQYNETIENQLELMLHELECDQIYIAQFHNGGHFYPTGKSIQKFSIFYEVTSPHCDALKTTYQNIPVSLFNKPLAELYETGEIAAEDIAKNNPFGLGTLNIGNVYKSGYMLTITDLDERIIGVIGIYFTEKTHKFDREEWAYIRLKVGGIGNLMSNYLHSKIS
jgi:hypothetical protein